MASARVTLLIRCNLEAQAITVRDYVNTLLAGKALDATDETLRVAALRGPGIASFWAVLGEWRFRVRSEAESVRDNVEAAWSGLHASTMRPGSWVAFHVCPHGDESEYNCRLDARSEYNRRSKA